METARSMILLIDDQAMVGELIRRMIAGEEDLVLHYLADPSRAVEVAREIRPTVILQDLVMPGVDGLEVVRMFRASSPTAATPIVVLSSKEDPAVKGEAFAAGANDYLVKLPDRVELLARIRYHTNAYLAQQQRDASMRALRESQQQLLQANTALLETNQKLNQFVGMASHDLRNPLGVVLGFAKLLQRDEQSNPPTEQQRRALASIQSSAEFMLRLVNNLLDVSKIEAGELHLEKHSVDLSRLVRDNVSLNRFIAEDKQIEIELLLGDDIPPMCLDPDKIEQVLNNLISNAIKFSQPRTTVTVFLDRTGDEVRLTVADEGPGIPADEQDKLFKPFGRTSVRTTKGEKSTGLGLVISKQVVDGHGGRILIDSKVGRGTSLSVYLPIEQRAA
jgi:signal transduction histidine kinase